jgi:hypothetical protein
MIAGGGYMAQKQQRERLAAFATESATTTGVVTKRSVEVMNGNTQFWDLEVQFTAPDGAQHTQEFRVPQAKFDQYGDGAPIPVTYVKSDPSLFSIPGGELNPGDVPLLGMMWKIGAAAAVLLAIGFGISLYMARNVGNRGGPPPGKALPPRSFGATRSSFGSRDLKR